LRAPISKKKNPHTHKKAGGVAQGVGPEFKSQYCEKRKKAKVGCLREVKYSNHFYPDTGFY
jgi:hypothetical protein